MSAPALRAEGLRRELGGRSVVDGVTLEVGRGEVVALLGPNGAGKTTLIRMLAGALAPDAGRVLLGGANVTGWPLHRRARGGLGYLPQEASAFAGLTARDNVEAALEQARAMRRAERRDAAAELLELFELGALAERLPGTLSGGERRRLELARLLAIAPRVVLLDEPFAGLDPLAIEQLTRQIERLTARDVGVLLADHNVGHALTIGQRACILIDGRLVAEGPPAQLLSNETARTFFGKTFFGADSFDPSVRGLLGPDLDPSAGATPAGESGE